MAKRRGKSSSRTKSRSDRGSSRKSSSSRRKSSSSRSKTISKEKKRKFISKISKDRKISKKEGQKAARKGISLRKIQNRNIGDYRQASRDYERSGRPGQYKAPSGRPQYEPLKIKRGAEQADRRRQESRRKSSSSSKKRSSSRKPRSSSKRPPERRRSTQPDQVVNAPQVDFQPFEPDMPDFQSMFDQQAADYQNQLDAMRAEQAAAAEEYRRQAEEQRRQFELQQRTMIGNEARAGQQASFQLGGAPGMKRGGTFGFRRRRRRLMGGIGAGGLAGAAASANTGGTLNV